MTEALSTYLNVEKVLYWSAS